jgi:hypothetical protein
MKLEATYSSCRILTDGRALPEASSMAFRQVGSRGRIYCGLLKDDVCGCLKHSDPFANRGD